MPISRLLGTTNATNLQVRNVIGKAAMISSGHGFCGVQLDKRSGLDLLEFPDLLSKSLKVSTVSLYIFLFWHTWHTSWIFEDFNCANYVNCVISFFYFDRFDRFDRFSPQTVNPVNPVIYFFILHFLHYLHFRPSKCK